MRLRTPSPPTNRFFVNTWVEQHYRVHPRQADTFLRIPALKWRGNLRRITPRVAHYLATTQSNIVFAR
jgi:hypothetical protein